MANTWLDEKYKTIEITGGPDATNPELIAWLEANATLEDPDYLVKGSTMAHIAGAIRSVDDSTATLTPAEMATKIAGFKGTPITADAISGQAYQEGQGDYAWKSTVQVPAGYHKAQTIEKTFDMPEYDGELVEIAGLYDANDVQLVAWSKSGIDNTCSNAATIIRNYPTCTKVIIGNNVTSIGEYAFDNSNTLTSVTISDSVTSISNYAFHWCTGLTSVTIGSGVMNIGNAAFFNCNSLTSLTIGNSVTTIGNSAFKSCSSLTSITIPDGVTSISDDVFSDCESLSSVSIPNGVTNIGNSAFSGCSRLTSITIPNGVTSIGYNAFYYCTNLTSITIPDGVTSIGSETFSECYSLANVTIPDSVTSIDALAFWYCSELVSITFNGTIAQWNAISKGPSWDEDTGDYIVHCTDGDIPKS